MTCEEERIYRREYMRAYRKRNPEAVKRSRDRWRLSHREHVAAYNRANRGKWPGKFDKIASSRRDYERHRETRIASVLERYHMRFSIRHVVYVVECAGLFKIGRTKKPDHRYLVLRNSNAAPIAVVVEITVLDGAAGCALERKLHVKFKSQRDHGEWFGLSQADVSWLRGLVEDAA